MFKNRVSAAFVLIKSQGISIILLLLLNYWAGSPDVRQRVIKLIKKKRAYQPDFQHNSDFIEHNVPLH